MTTLDTFLCACLRLRYDPSALDEVRAGAHALGNDWGPAVRRIKRERIAPLLFRTIGDHDGLPPGVQRALVQAYRQASVRNLLLLHATKECLQCLADARVPAILLKGAALAEVIYANLALRPMSDVDILVHPTDVPRVRQILERLGYTLDRVETHPGVLTEHENELSFSRAGNRNATIDVHWSLFDSPYYQRRIAMDWFWQSAVPVRIGKESTLMLGPEAQVIHLCGHLGLHHQNEGLLWWHDIAEVLVFHRERIDWNLLLAKTREYGLLLPVRAILTRVVRDWRAPVPAAVLTTLERDDASADEQRVFAGLSVADRPPGQRLLTDISSMTDWRQRLRFARTNLVPSAAYMRQRYQIGHPLLLPFYYPYRWLRGMRGLRLRHRPGRTD